MSEIAQKPKKPSTLRRVLRVIGVLALIALLCFAALVGWVYYQETHVAPPGEYDSIIVLGAQVLPTGEPSVQLRWRLDKALEMYGQSSCPVVVCGAKGGQEPRAEGEIMRELLIADGIPADQVYADTESMDTKQNMRNAREILAQLGCERPLVVTSDYHLPRALAIAEDAGFHPQGAGSPCRPEVGFWLKNHGREALAWCKYWLVKFTGVSL